MAKQRNTFGYRELEEEEDEELLEEEGFFSEELPPKTVKLMLAKDMILTVIGSVTGKVYVFNRGGSIVEVDEKDAESMQSKIRGTPSCCGSYSSPYFEIVR